MLTSSPALVYGSTALPSGFRHRHASKEARAIAQNGMILRVQGLAATRYLGYLRGQKAAMTGRPGAHTNRPELVAVHGYDTKYAMHALRLGLQGIELLSTGRITLPVPEPDRAYLRSIRRGERPLSEVLEAISDAEARLAALRDSAAIADQPDREWVDGWLHRTYQNFWDRGR
jgi:hypothetical protein